MKGCLDHFVQFLGNHIILFVKRCLAYLGQYPPDIRLKNNYDDEKDRIQESSQKPVKREQIKLAGDKIENGNDDNSGEHLYSSGATDEQNDSIYDD